MAKITRHLPPPALRAKVSNRCLPAGFHNCFEAKQGCVGSVRSIGRLQQKVERAHQSHGQNQRLLAGIQAKQDDKGGWVMSPPTAASVWPEPSLGAAPLDQQLPTHLPISWVGSQSYVVRL